MMFISANQRLIRQVKDVSTDSQEDMFFELTLKDSVEDDLLFNKSDPN